MGANIVQDGAFDVPLKSGKSPWLPYGGGRENSIRIVRENGNSMLELVDVLKDKAIGVRQNIPVKPGQGYRASLLVKALPDHVGDSISFQVRLLPAGIIRQIAVKADSADTFEKYELFFSVPAGINKACIYIYSNHKALGRMLVDQVLIEPYDGDIADGTPGDRKAAKLQLPADCTVAKLNQTPRPMVFLSPESNAKARKHLASTPHLQSFLARQHALVKNYLALSDGELRSLIPPPGKDILYGLGLNVCPQGGRLRWGGIRNPFKVIGKDQILYPNEKSTPEQVKDYTARAHGFVYAELDERVLPALADCYLLTGDKKYARCIAVLMDRLAQSYCANLRGPLDYPTSSNDYLRGGRLQRPYYQVARGLMNYVHAFDAVLPSGELDAPSVVSGRTRGENIIRDLLWNGAIYCLGFAYDGTRMHNGHVDYMRGAAAVGLLLNIPVLAEPLFSEDIGFPAVLNTAVNRNGLYTESSFMYSQHSIELYRDLAAFYDSAVRQKWPGIKRIYDDPVFCSLLDRYADKLEVGGKVPMTGDDGPQMYVAPPAMRTSASAGKGLDRGFPRQMPGVWELYIHGSPEQRMAAARYLRNVHGNEPCTPPLQRSLVWNISKEDLKAIESLPPDKDYLGNTSNIFGSKGLALIRGGRGADRHGFQMIFGPQLNHGQAEALSWTFYDQGAEWSYDQGYLNTHFRMGWTSISVSHQQMVVDGEIVKVANGGGELLAFCGNNPSGIQYVVAKQDHAFSKSKRFERLLGQADHPESGNLEYWFDLGIVEGGSFRDDSFHSAMGQVEYNDKFTPTGEHSLFGDVTKGMTVLPNFRLSGYPEKGFYWRPPGNGYGFLIQPALRRSGEDLRGEFSQTVLKLFPGQKLDPVLVADFPGESGREYYSVRSMDTHVVRSVPYLIRRDRGDGISFFAKFLHFRMPDGADPVCKVAAVPVSGDGENRAYLVTLSDGRSDLWIAGCTDGNKKVTVPGFPEVAVKGKMAVIRFDADKKVKYIQGSCSTLITAGAVRLAGVPALTGTIRKLDDTVPGLIRFEVDWDKAPAGILQGPLPVLTRADGALPAVWTAAAVDKNGIALKDLRSTFSRVRLEKVRENPGYYRTVPELLQIYTPLGGGASRRILQGKYLRNGKNILGKVGNVDISDPGRIQFQLLDAAGKGYEYADGMMVDILEAVPGTRVEVPQNLFLQ